MLLPLKLSPSTQPREPYTLSNIPSGIPGLSDYATKIWGGLVKYYHAQRLQLWLDIAHEALVEGKPFDQERFITEFLSFAVTFENTKWNSTELPATPQVGGD